MEKAQANQNMFTISYIAVEGYGCFIGPAASNIPNGIASSTKQQHWQVPLLDELNTSAMT